MVSAARHRGKNRVLFLGVPPPSLLGSVRRGRAIRSKCRLQPLECTLRYSTGCSRHFRSYPSPGQPAGLRPEAPCFKGSASQDVQILAWRTINTCKPIFFSSIQYL